MLPINSENKSKPERHKTMENNVSPRNVLVAKVCPYELQEKVLISINSKEYNWIAINTKLQIT